VRSDRKPPAAGAPQRSREIEVLIVCRAELLMLGLERLLSQSPGMRPFTYSQLPDSAREHGGADRPARDARGPVRVALLSDRRAPDVVHDCERALGSFADEAVLLWGSHDMSVLTGCMGAGARAFVMEGDPPAVLTTAIRSAAAGTTYVGQRAVEALVDWLAHEQRSRGSGAERRDLDLLRLLAEGRTTVDIAQRLGLAPKTVRNRASRLYQRLGVHSRAAAVRLAEQRGLLDRP
jgi:DNA-binding NarL/FixJ family response regulator